VSDPVGAELEFTTENSISVTQKVLPTFGVVLATGGEAFGLAGTFDATMAVHREQGIELAGPLPPEGRVITISKLAGIYDKGAGAIVTAESRSVDAETGEWRFTTTSSLFVRGAGGFGGVRGPSAGPNRPPNAIPITYCALKPDAIRHCFTGSSGITTHCTRTPSLPSAPGSRNPSSMGSAPTGSRVDSSCMHCASQIRPGSSQ
jgi:hypothetical protein